MPHVLTRRRTVVLLVVAAAIVSALVWWFTGRTSSQAGPSDLETRTVQAGQVEVTMTPLILDRSGALFRLKLDTHTVPLDLDLAAASQLVVNGAPGEAGTWTGQGSGGHHREGTVRFTTPIPTGGATVQLRISGLPHDATGTWTAP